jgi:hypothetical protein
LKCGEEPGAKHLTRSQEVEYCAAFRDYLCGSSSKWKPHHFEATTRESLILKLRDQVLQDLKKAHASPTLISLQLSASVEHQQPPEEVFDFEMSIDGMFSQKWKPQKGIFRDGRFWTGSSQNSINGRLQSCSLSKDKQHNFHCLDCIFEEESTSVNGKEHTLKFKSRSDSREHVFAFSSASARNKCLEGFANNLPTFDGISIIDSAPTSYSVKFSAKFDGFDIVLRSSQSIHGDCAKLALRDAGFQFENRDDEEIVAEFSIENLLGTMTHNNAQSLFVFLATNPLHGQSSGSEFLSVKYEYKPLTSRLVVQCSNSTDICVNNMFQDFLHSWWEFAKSDRSESDGNGLLLSSNAALLKSSSLTSQKEPKSARSNEMDSTVASPLAIHVTVHAPRCIFASGNQVLILCLGKFQFQNAPSSSLQLGSALTLNKNYHFAADGFILKHVTFFDISITPDVTTDFGTEDRLLTTIISECPFSLDMTFPDECLNTGAVPCFKLHFRQPLHLNLEPAFMKFVFQRILPVVNRLTAQSAILADYFMQIFKGDSHMLFELTHEQQQEMLLRLHSEKHPGFDALNAQYEFARDSEDMQIVFDFCQELGRIHQSVIQKVACYSFVFCFDHFIELNLNMNANPSDPRAIMFRIAFVSPSVGFDAKILAATIDLELAQNLVLDCRISTVDCKGGTDFIHMDVILSTAIFKIQELGTNTSLVLSSQFIKASLSPQQVEFFTHLFRNFQEAIVNPVVEKISADGNQFIDSLSMAGAASVQTKLDSVAIQTTKLNIAVHLSKIEVDLKSGAHEHKQLLKLFCEEINFVMGSTSEAFNDQPLQQISEMNFSMERIKARSFCSSEHGLELVHVSTDVRDHTLTSHQVICVRMRTEQIQIDKSSSKFSSQNVISVESKHPLIFVIDARSICQLFELSMQLVDAAGNPNIVITSSYTVDFSFETLSLDLIIDDDRHFRLSFCLPQDGSKSTNRVISSPGTHKSDQNLSIGNLIFGVVNIHNSDLQTATYQSLIIDNVSFSVIFEVGNLVAKNLCCIKTLGSVTSTVSYQDLQQLYLFLFHPLNGLLACWTEVNRNIQPSTAIANSDVLEKQPFAFLFDIPAKFSIEFANDCPPYSKERLFRLEMEQFIIQSNAMVSSLLFQNLSLIVGFDSTDTFQGDLKQYRDRVGEFIHGFIIGSASGLVCGSGNIYSDDSDVATAAVHGGFCSVGERKRVCIQILGSVDGLNSLRANGISSRACARWPGSFSFVSNDTMSSTSQLLSLSNCQITYDVPQSIADIDCSNTLSISISLPVVDRLKQRIDYISHDWESFQSKDHPLHYSGHVYSRLHNKSDSSFTIRRVACGPQLVVARFEHVDLDDTWYPNFVLQHNKHEAVVSFQESAYPGLHFEFHTTPDQAPRYHLFVYSQVIFENYTCADFILCESELDGSTQAHLNTNQRFSTTIAASDALTINVGPSIISGNLSSLPVHFRSTLARDSMQSSAFGCIQHVASQLFVYPEGGRRLILKAMVNDNQEGYVFRLCRDGSLQHVETGLLVHPEGGNGVVQAHLVLHEDGSEPRLWFALSDGCIRHILSGLFVHPLGGTGMPNVPVILHNDGPGAAIQDQIHFKFVSIPPNSEIFVEPEAPISAPEFPCYFLRHVHTAMYVHPEGGTAECGVRLVLWPGHHNHERRLMFSLRPDGNLQHVDSGLFVHPKGGKAKSGIELILHPDGPETRLAFNHDGCFRHRESGLYVHPKQGKGTKGSALMFHPDDASRAYPGELQYALEPVQIVVTPKLSLSEGRRIKLSGNLRHALSHLYVHPEGGIGVSGARIILYKGGNERRLSFALRNDGCIQHVESGLFVHPRGGFAKFGVDLILHPDGPEERLAFELEPKFGCLRHIRSGLYIHPAGGEGKHGVHLLLHNDGPEQRLVYEFMPLKFDVNMSGNYHGPICLGHVDGVAQSMWCCSKNSAGGSVSTRTFLPFLFLQSELSRSCEIQLFDMSNAFAEPQQVLQSELGVGVRLPCMSSCQCIGLKVSFNDGLLTSEIQQVTWQNLVIGHSHAFGATSIELRGEGGLMHVG